MSTKANSPGLPAQLHVFHPRARSECTVCGHIYIRALPLPPRYRSVWSDPSHSHLVKPECHRPAWMTIRCASSVRWSQPTCKGIDLNRLDNDSMFRLLQDRFIKSALTQRTTVAFSKCRDVCNKSEVLILRLLPQ